ncbi:MAG TPA: 30S ribosomal protein S27e, partial [Thermoplasmataceae archaeon]|nr:30S ribosomal protein S27e [Thermoplasmataceae archaeon]
CRDCENVQVTYSKGSSTVVCNICGATLVSPTGGTISTNAEVLEVLK